MVTYLGVSRISANQFGYVGGGFRRYFLLPSTGRHATRGQLRWRSNRRVHLPVALLAFAIFVPYALDARMLLMLLCSGLMGCSYCMGSVSG